MSKRLWKEAASLLMVVKASERCAKYGFDYRILVMQRSSKSQFMPNAYVFPGGVVERSDFKPEWMKLFHHCGLDEKNLRENLCHNGTVLPPFYQQWQLAQNIFPDLGFRICAIREMFEESGILLAREFPSVVMADRKEMKRLQREVHNDAEQFLQIFHRLGGYPDVLSLHNWSGWLTPPGILAKRFDTAFYIAFCDHLPSAPNEDEQEVGNLRVVSPAEVVHDWMQEHYFLPPPQVYELSRLLQCSDYENLRAFTATRAASHPITRWMGVIKRAKDGYIHFLPGDDLYPINLDFEGCDITNVPTEFTMDELREKTQNFHRMEMTGPFNCRVVTNIASHDEHLIPVDCVKFIRDLTS